MISHTLINVQKPCQLQNYIDNRDSTKMIGLKSITYWYRKQVEEYTKSNNLPQSWIDGISADPTGLKKMDCSTCSGKENTPRTRRSTLVRMEKRTSKSTIAR